MESKCYCWIPQCMLGKVREGRIRAGGEPMSLEGALAANRFGLGAKPGEIEDSALFKADLADHLGVPKPVLEDRVFPDSAAAPAPKGLIRA